MNYFKFTIITNILFFPLILKVIKTIQFNPAPENIAVIKGHPLQMTCGHFNTNEVHWSFWQVGLKPKDAVAILSDNKTSHKYVSNKTGQSTLNVASVEMSDAGTYECTIYELITGKNSIIEKAFQAQVIILASEPNCSIPSKDTKQNSVLLAEGEVIKMQCSLVYNGNWDPVMEWKRSDKPDIIVGGVNGVTSKNHQVTSEIFVFADVTNNDHKYYCTTRFSQVLNSSFGGAENIPSFTRTWEAPQINILHKPRNLLIVPRQQIFNPGENLTCIVEANPISNYSWRNLLSGKLVQGELLNVTEDMIGENEYECTASNKFGNIAKSVQFKVMDYKLGQPVIGASNDPIVPTAVLTPLVTALFVICSIGAAAAVYNCVKKKSCRKQERKVGEKSSRISSHYDHIQEDEMVPPSSEVSNNNNPEQPSKTTVIPVVVQSSVATQLTSVSIEDITALKPSYSRSRLEFTEKIAAPYTPLVREDIHQEESQQTTVEELPENIVYCNRVPSSDIVAILRPN